MCYDCRYLDNYINIGGIASNLYRPQVGVQSACQRRVKEAKETYDKGNALVIQELHESTRMKSTLEIYTK